MKNAKRNILFVAQDAGGFNAIYPVYKSLKLENPDSVTGIFGDVSRKLVKDSDVPFVDVTTMKRENLEELFNQKKPDVLVVGTSSGLSMDKLATAIATQRGIPSIAVIDYWSNYSLRFSDPDTKNLAYIPTKIAVIDDVCRDEMVAEGFDSARIVVTGNPSFEKYADEVQQSTEEGIILFVSQPFSELIADKSGIDYGYDEREVFQDVINALQEIGVENEIVVKHHPRTKDFSVFDSIILGSSLSVSTDKETPTDELVAQSVLVIGMCTMALFEAALRGKKVLSYQPHLNNEDPLVGNRIGLTVPVYERTDLLQTVQRLLASSEAPSNTAARERYVYGRATEKLVNLIQSL